MMAYGTEQSMVGKVSCYDALEDLIIISTFYTCSSHDDENEAEEKADNDE